MGHTLDDLALLVDVVRAGGVRAVARSQGVPRSTISRRLHRLEASLGLTLTRRGAGQLELSEGAQAAFERLARVVDEAREVSGELGDRQRAPSGVLRLATTALFAEHLLPDLMARYLAANPKVRVEVLSSTDRLDLSAERVDVAIRGGPLEDLGSFTSKKLGALTVCLYCSPAYAKRRGLPMSVDALATHDLLVSTSRPAGTQWVLQRRDGRKPVRVLGRLHSTNDNLPVRAGRGHSPCANLCRRRARATRTAGAGARVDVGARGDPPRVPPRAATAHPGVHRTGPGRARALTGAGRGRFSRGAASTERRGTTTAR
jgi:DNA-binding transcriptional LysR family regulator